MSSKEANIAVVVGGDTSKLRSDLKEGGRALESFEDKASKMQKQLAKVAIGATTAGAAIGGVLLLKSAAAAKEIKNLAFVANTGVQSFQDLSIAARGYGVEQDKVSDILKDTSDKVGDFLTTGGGALADYFDQIAPKIGQTAEEFKNLSGQQALQKYVNGLEKANLSQSEMVFFMEAIASDATLLLPLLSDNGKELAVMAENTNLLGLAMSDLEIEKLEEMSGAVAEATNSMEAMSNQLSAELAPVVTYVATAFTDFIKSAGGVRNVLANLQPYLDGLVLSGKLLVALYGSQMVASMYKFSASVVVAGASTSTLAAKLVIAQVAAKGMRIATLALSNAMKFLGGPVGVLAMAASALFIFATSTKNSVTPSKDLNEQIEAMTFNFDNMSKAAAKVELINVEKQLIQASKGIEEAQVRQRVAVDKVAATNSYLIREQENLNKAIGRNDTWRAEQAETKISQLNNAQKREEETLLKANLALEQAIAEEERLLKGKAGLQGIATGTTAKKAEDDTSQATMEKRAKDNEALIAQQVQFNSDMVDAIDFEAMERKEKGYYERKAAAQVANNELLIENHKQTLDTQAQLDEMNSQRQRDFVSGTSKMFGDLSSLMGSENKKLFAIGKAAAIAQATIDGISAAVSSFKFGSAIGGPILGGAFAAASAVSTGMMIKQISSQQFGGGAQTANAGGGGSLPQADTQSSQPAQANGTLTVQGLTPDISALAEQLLDYERNGGRVTLG